jgi:NhaA family Na+:H+ antiporter
VATLPDDASWRQIAGAGALGGIGFTVSLFITELAFAESDSARAAKIGIIAASMIASAFGALLASNAEKVQRGPSAELESPDD